MAENKGRLSVWTGHSVEKTLPIRDQKSHKGTYGTGLLIAGSRDMPGAALLSGLGAMRSGIGKLEIGTESEVIPLVVPVLPEATYIRNGLEKVADGTLELHRYRAAAIGPGIVPNRIAEHAIEQLVDCDFPVVLDAGALTERSYNERPAPIILTPHPGEFSRITGVSTTDLEKRRGYYVSRFAKELGVTIVLKGHQTVIAFPDGETWVNATGNASLAKGGTGDTLTGMILGMLCCHEDWKHAVLNAVFLHGACADHWAATRSTQTLLAHELTDFLPEVWKKYEPK
ncbi:NAD(P)H-hydrate dehydratase [Planococcus shenhongbingii]|uniref:NAD(P)H-hydrate dehydratase n=1 Tax=Planococcus shenhongbingii TaxID=3058398 RepID=UPI002628E4AD|nr:NAD(P)H-hydrate dehydratase [Planococcus sp. N016]WKA56881.1 NAD(P)H-hydrate dehydratase [Planococcus sp. N016]